VRVGLNLAYLVQDSGGSGTYARELIPRLVERGAEVTAWVGATAPEDLHAEPWAPDVRWIRLPVPGIGTPWHLLHELSFIGLDAARRRLDVLHGLANLTPLTAPGVATVSTILDVIWMHHPEALEPRARIVMRTLVPLVARSVRRVLTISEAARDDIAATLRLDPAKLDVAQLGITPPSADPALLDEPALRERLGLDERPLVLCVAAKRAHKNLDGLVRALAELPAPRPQLVLPGAHNAYEDGLRELAAELGVAGDVRFPGWISDAELEGLYRLARCFVLPSFQEGFGLPVLEAMARGVPVACSDVPALAEVAGPAALLFDPRDSGSMASAVGRLLTDDRLVEALVRDGRERCERFTWERTAELTLRSYARALEG
jgi:glycosyltransferase involved in cell wall biosynthesis